MRTANANNTTNTNTNNGNANNNNDNGINGKLIRNLTFLVLAPLFAVSLLGGLVAANTTSVSNVAAANSGPWE